LARIRQVGELLPAKIYFGKKTKVVIEKSITGVSEGQAIVLYSGKKVLGGGEIRFK
jgi:tRNA U34 2-thiouridine synthase MnmA/TrmU